MMSRQKFTPRLDYRKQESRRVAESPSLADTYPKLRSLTVESSYFNPIGNSQNKNIKYTVNPVHAKAVFRIDCNNAECVGGDFDLSDVLARAVPARQETATGEMTCKGWLSKTVIDQVRCGYILRYKLTMEY